MLNLMTGAIPLLPLYAFMASTLKLLPLRLPFKFQELVTDLIFYNLLYSSLKQ
jgi:hypothetical protein